MTEDGWREERKYVLSNLVGIQDAIKENHKEVADKLDKCHVAITEQQNTCDTKYATKTVVRYFGGIMLGILSAVAGGILSLYIIVNDQGAVVAANKVKIEEVSKAVEKTLSGMEVSRGWISYKTKGKLVRVHYHPRKNNDVELADGELMLVEKK